MRHKGSEFLQENKKAQDWARLLAAYRNPSVYRSSWEIAVTLVLYIGLWIAAWAVLDYSKLLAVLISCVNALILLRLFCIQHDCGHGTLFKNKPVNDWIGRVLGVLTLTPYDVWKRSHAVHHGASGNLCKRGIGDIDTLTLAEYQALSLGRKIQYRLYRHPITLFVIGPAYLFFVKNRLPFGLMSNMRFWVSAMVTNIALAACIAVIAYFGGLAPILFIFIPTTLLAAMIGVWLFYVQHQFEHTYWETDPNWNLHEAALDGSSHYVLPRILQWATANIGIHHVHHLSSRIPFYRLSEVLRDHPSLADMNILTVSTSLKKANLHLWDETNKRLVSFSKVSSKP